MSRDITLEDAIKLLSAVAVPLVIAIIGFQVQHSISNAETKAKTLELAIQILQQPMGNPSQPGLRQWAIDTLEASSPVSLSEDARRELQSKPLLATQEVQRHIQTGGFHNLLTCSIHVDRGQQTVS